MFRGLFKLFLAPIFALTFLALLEWAGVTGELVRRDPVEAIRRLRVHVDPRAPRVIYAGFLDPRVLPLRFAALESCLVWWRWIPSVLAFAAFLAWRSGCL